MSTVPLHALSPDADAGTALLELKGITKSFGSVPALNRVDLIVRAGEVHAIVGENGAGKSTLVTIAAGALTADAGAILVGGAPVTHVSVSRMREAGVAIAYQHPALPPDLTVLECISLVAPDYAARRGAARARDLLASISTPMLRVTPEEQIGGLTLAQRHIVENARALATDPSVIVFDEPTEPLQETDVKKLFEVIAGLKQAGKGIVYISHRLNDVKQIADRISILRDGELVTTRPAAELQTAEIIDLIVGRSLAEAFPPKGTVVRDRPALRVVGASGDNFSDIDLEIFAGEIVGLVGVEGQGQREFIRALAGAANRRGGEIQILDMNVASAGRKAAQKAGVGFVPDDRHREGLFLPLSVRENLAIGQLASLAPYGYVSPRVEADAIRRDIQTFRVRTSGPDAAVAMLSGGNQQKVLLAREIAAEPRALLLDEPTKGVDVGSRSEIYQRLRELSATKVPILVCSSDGVELEGLCDRVLVFSRGRIIRELVGDEVTDTNITAANLGATALRTTEAISGAGWQRLLGSLFSGVYMPIVALTLLIAIVAGVAGAWNPRFLTALSITPALALATILILVSLAQFSVVLIGEFDLSVGPLTGLVVVMASYAIPDGAALAEIVGGSLGVVLICAVIGFVQGLAIFYLRLPSIVVTLATFFGFQGFSLLLRPLPGGYIEASILDAFTFPILNIPVVFIITVLITFGLERVLFRWAIGREVRASGSNQAAAFKLGVSRARVGLVTFTVAGFLTGFAGLILAAEVGYGISGLGVDYTLMSVTAVVLGGAAITGGRGSFIATLFGALLVQVIISATPFLRIGTEWNYWITGLTTLLAGGLFGLSRSSGTDN